MKKTKIRVVCALLFTAFAVVQAAAQDTREANAPVNQSEYAVRQISIDKIYVTPKCYVIRYRKGVLGDQKVYAALPFDWFDKASKHDGEGNDFGKGQIIRLDTGPVWPYLVVYSKGGALDHIRLYISKWDWHPTWATADDSAAVQKLIADAENLKL
ncbi:MAG: hypothetical protein LBC72_00880 [Spirochaetaceae bacterium]|jgi:hypothetical protein|nr:hypothetical protein [Spirochaetaceae bacterium]